MSSNHRNPVEYVTIVFSFLLAIIMFVTAGTSFGVHHFASGASLMVSAVFLGAVTIAIVWARFQALRDFVRATERELEYSQKRLRDALDEARNLRGATQKQDAVNMTAAAPMDAGHVAPPETAIDPALKALLDRVLCPILESIEESEKDMNVLKAVVRDLGLENGEPNPTNFPAICKAFHDNTDRYLRFTPAGDKFLTEFSDAPFEETATPEVVKSNEEFAAEKAKAAEVAKPLTKTQQRRKNAKAGKGAFTDDELKQQRSDKRRAARLAKKADITTTTTTTEKE